MKLYKWGRAGQPHYVVAMDYGDAEDTICLQYKSPWIDELECLGPYVQVSERAIQMIHDLEKEGPH